MAGKLESEDSDEVIAEINIIPFVDIVLVILVIFMLTSAAIVRASMRVDLPKAAAGGAAVESTLNVVFTLEGKLLVNGAETDNDGLADFTRRLAADNPELQAVIAADKGVEYGDVIGIIDIVKKNGVKAFALNIERRAN